MQIKNTMLYHLTPVQWLFVLFLSKRQQITSVDEDVEKWNPCALLMRMEIGTASMKQYGGSQKLKNRTSI